MILKVIRLFDSGIAELLVYHPIKNQTELKIR